MGGQCEGRGQRGFLKTKVSRNTRRGKLNRKKEKEKKITRLGTVATQAFSPQQTQAGGLL
jgi:hypothetical protein